MNKLFIFTALLAISTTYKASADMVYIVDDNNMVKQQIYTPNTTSTTVTQQKVVVSQPTVAVTQPQVIVTQPQPQEVVVVQPQPYPYERVTRHYDPLATAAVIGITGALIGHSVFSHHHHHRYAPPPRHGWHRPRYRW